MIGACLCFAAGFAIIKYLTADLPEPVIGFFRSLIAALCFLPLAVRRGPRFFLTTRPVAHLWRAAVGFTSFLCLIYALGRMPLGDAVALTFTTPLWSILAGIVIFGDRPGLRLWLAIVAGFVGVILISQPTGEAGFGVGAAFALISAVLSAFAILAIKQLVGTEPPDRVAFYFMAISTLIALAISVFDWTTPQPRHWLPLIVIGVLYFVGQTCLTRAYFYGTLSKVAPLDFVRLPASVAVGYVWFQEIPAALAVGGMALIFLAALDILYAARRGGTSPQIKP